MLINILNYLICYFTQLGQQLYKDQFLPTAQLGYSARGYLGKGRRRAAALVAYYCSFTVQYLVTLFLLMSVGSEKVEHNISTDQSSVSSETSRSRNRSRGVSRCTKPRRAGSLQRSKSVGSVPNPAFTPDGGKPSWEHDCVEYYGKDGELGGVLPEKYSVDGEAPFSPEIHERSNLIVYSQALPPSYASFDFTKQELNCQIIELTDSEDNYRTGSGLSGRGSYYHVTEKYDEIVDAATNTSTPSAYANINISACEAPEGFGLFNY
ncbi:uncharacterized protein LOC134846614 [Symsagittifera roscoffensis]|uniref:uncharacterized protein LOC134846614 n=1 Tax=Symsagittifera roscoffensis TaxID=84072 RepID=UPI00307BE8D2